jgi:hypothetical protein
MQGIVRHFSSGSMVSRASSLQSQPSMSLMDDIEHVHEHGIKDDEDLMHGSGLPDLSGEADPAKLVELASTKRPKFDHDSHDS